MNDFEAKAKSELNFFNKIRNTLIIITCTRGQIAFCPLVKLKGNLDK